MDIAFGSLGGVQVCGTSTSRIDKSTGNCASQVARGIALD